MVNLELYRIFYAVAEAGNITKASRRLNISQPAVTKQIKNLEDALGCSLFVRSQKGVVLNDAGQEIFLMIKQSLSLIDDAEKKIQSLETLEEGTIKIGISASLTKHYLMKYINKFNKLYPNIIVEISTNPTSKLIKSLKLGTLDFIIAKEPKRIDRELEYNVLGKMQDIFVVNQDYLDLTKHQLKIKDILKYPILLQKQPSNSRETIDNYCDENNIIINSIMNITSSSLLVEFVKIGYGVGFVTKEYIKEELNNKELYELSITPKIKSYSFGIITLKNNLLSFSSNKFIEILTRD